MHTRQTHFVGVVALFACSLLFGCNQDSAPGGRTVDTGVDGSDSNCATSPCPVSWSDGPEFLRPLDHHTAGLLQDGGDSWLVVIGGARSENRQPQETYNQVSGAPVSPDGSLGTWEDLVEFNLPLLGHAQAVGSEGNLFLLSGITQDDGGELTAARAVTSLSIEDGDIAAEQGTHLPQGRRHASAHVLNGKLVIIGGIRGGQATTSVMTSPLLSDGVNGDWSEAPGLPAPRTHHASVKHDGRIYVFGGSDLASGTHTDILRSTVDQDGNITGWESVGQWEGARFSMAPIRRGDTVYLAGGVGGSTTQGRPVDTVTSIELTEEGIENITNEPQDLPIGRSHGTVAPLHRASGTVYLVGGRTSQTFDSTSRVFIGQFGQ